LLKTWTIICLQLNEKRNAEREPLNKQKLLLIPFSLGLIFIISSWFLSYPLGLNSAGQSLFDNISILYWLSLPLLLVPLYLAAIVSRNNFKWIFSIGIVIVLYSISYFYLMLPGSDSQFFRGMNEYLIDSQNLSPLQPNHGYFQWPSFFLLTSVASSISGLSIQSFEFVLYTIIGFLLTISLHFYASQQFKNYSFLMVIAFFISMFYFLNYQCVPFSLALGLLFLMFVLESKPQSLPLTIIIEILFVGLVLTHAFVPLFFIIYLFFRTILDRNRYYGQLFLFALSLYFIIQLTLAQYSFAANIIVLLRSTSEYSSMIQATGTPVFIPLDNIAQVFSRGITIVAVAISGIGFVYLFVKRKLRNVDKALLLTGTFYTGLGFFLAALGSRAIILAFVPVALGLVWLFESKFNKHFKRMFSLVIVLLLTFFLFIPLHLSFGNSVQYQTREAYKAENFFIDHINWEDYPSVFAYSSVTFYIQARIGIDTNLTPYIEEGKGSDIMLYTLGLGKDMSLFNYTSQKVIAEGNLDLVYNNGYSLIAPKPGL
jgi:hypothetical protein